MSAITTKELDNLEAAMLAFFHATWRPKIWEDVQRRSGVSLDKSSATLLKVLKSCDTSKCRIQDIAHHLNIEAPSVSRTVQELERAGLVVRHQDDTDKRASNIELTETGEDTLAKLQAAKRERLKATLQDWPAEDRRDLARLLTKLAESSTAQTSE